ncbi:MAG: ECF-type sigma factor [Fuerstiella sp.]
MSNVTVLLNSIEQGKARTEDLLPLVYGELRRLAAAHMLREQPGQTLQATALVHEAFLRLVDCEDATWENRRHFFGAAALAMQRILVEQARRKSRLKHGGDIEREQLSDMNLVAENLPAPSDLLAADDLLAIDDALSEFSDQEPDKAELIRLRYFAGLTEPEAAAALNISRATASRWWTYSKAWLFAKVNGKS